MHRSKPVSGKARVEKKGPYLRTRRRERGQAGLAPGLASKIVPLITNWLNPQRLYYQTDSFFPFPKITFIIDQPDLVCQICHESHFQMRPDSQFLNDTTFSILPCGHVAGQECMQEALRLNDRGCPFCRYEMRYSGCGHAIPPRPITTDSIHLLPPTLYDDGSTPQLCGSCHKANLKVEAEQHFNAAAHDFQSSRWRLAASGDVRDEDDALSKRGLFENAIRDQLHLRNLHHWLTNW